jgi:hypothetical protein
VELDTEYLSKQDVQAVLIHGGKTKVISLLFPKRIFNAMLETSMIKKHVRGPPKAGTLYFIDLDGKVIPLKSAYDTVIAGQVFKVMGVPRYTATDARRGAATRMLELDLPETMPTGLSQSKTTQVKIYAENTEEQGIQSKLSANKEIFSYEASIESGSDTEHEEARRKQADETKKLGEESLANDWREAEWKNFTRDPQGRGPHRRILAKERFRLIYSIYNLDDLEWSCLFLAGERMPSSLDRMAKHLERYLYSDNPNVRWIRRDFARIAAALDIFTEVEPRMFRELARLIRESFRALNRRRLLGRGGIPKLHVLMNFTHMTASRQESDTESGSYIFSKRPVRPRGKHYF